MFEITPLMVNDLPSLLWWVLFWMRAHVAECDSTSDVGEEQGINIPLWRCHALSLTCVMLLLYFLYCSKLYMYKLWLRTRLFVRGLEYPPSIPIYIILYR